MKVQTKFGRCSYDFVDDYVHIYDLYIIPDYRRQGNARKLLLYIINEIRKTGWDKEIQIVADPTEDNINKNDLINFYKSLDLTVYEFYK